MDGVDMVEIAAEKAVQKLNHSKEMGELKKGACTRNHQKYCWTKQAIQNIEQSLLKKSEAYFTEKI